MLNTIWLLKTYLLRFNKYVKTILHKQQELLTGGSPGFLHQAMCSVHGYSLYPTAKGIMKNLKGPPSVRAKKKRVDLYIGNSPLET